MNGGNLWAYIKTIMPGARSKVCGLSFDKCEQRPISLRSCCQSRLESRVLPRSQCFVNLRLEHLPGCSLLKRQLHRSSISAALNLFSSCLFWLWYFQKLELKMESQSDALTIRCVSRYDKF